MSNIAETALYRCEQIKACERFAADTLHRSEHELMETAGLQAWQLILRRYPRVRRLVVFCGHGNNAGDGYVVARLAHHQGWQVTVFQCKQPQDLPSTAAHAAMLAIADGVICQPLEESWDGEADLVVDALLGTGLRGEVQGPLATAINQINAAVCPVVSLDIPSGLNADTGQKASVCVNARLTITFIAAKAGMFTLDGLDYCGEVIICDLDLSQALAHIKPFAQLIAKTNLPWPLPPRLHNSHKGNYGHVLIIGGALGMPGSVVMAGKAALRTGAGLVTVATSPEYAHTLIGPCPELMLRPIHSGADLLPLLALASVCVLGPGMDTSAWSRDIYQTAMTAQTPMVIDAGALRLLTEFPQSDDNWVLTPHPGEAAALLQCSSTDIQQNRFMAAETIQQQFGGTVVLKGAGTLVQSDQGHCHVCAEGNPGMATAGMGDILSGMIAGLIAQGLSLQDAARLGVWVHAVCGDLAAQTLGERGLLATDCLSFIPKIVNGLLP